MFGALDENGRLFVSESSGKDLYAELQKLTRECRISVLEDIDEDGIYEKTQVFANKLVFPMGLVWRNKRLYVADPPDLVALEDSDGDGRADRRTVILSGFGHTDNGSLHGLTFGPDGWLYITMGEPDGYRLKRADGSFLEGKSGALLRCRPDGSDVEVICRGFENLVEIVFMPSGEIVGTDNWFNWPADGIRDALVHLVEGGLYPLKTTDTGTKFFVNQTLPAIKTYPAVALSGFMRYHGSAFPTEMQNDLFSAQFNTRKIVRHELAEDGSTFRSADHDFLTTEDPDFHPSDVLEDVDESLLVIDTGSWYVHHCPTGRIRKTPAVGGIYRVRYDKGKSAEDPRGLKLDWNSPAESELWSRLADSRPAVRERAMERLINSGADGSAAERLAPSESIIWTLARLDNDRSREILRKWLSGKDPAVVALAARALARIEDKSAEPQLCHLLESPNSKVRFAAAEALTRCGSSQSIPFISKTLRSETDAFWEHALLYALFRLGNTHDFQVMLEDPNPSLQRAALILLDQQQSPGFVPETVIGRALHNDSRLAETARSILAKHPEWVEQALPFVRQLLASNKPENLDALSQFVSLFGWHPAISSELANAIAEKTSSSGKTRVTLLEAMARVPTDKFPESWRNTLSREIESGSAEERSQAIKTANAIQLRGLETALAAVARDANAPDSVRIEALRAVLRDRTELNQSEFNFLLDQLRSSAPPERLAAFEVLTAARLLTDQLQRMLPIIGADPLFSAEPVWNCIRRTSVKSETEQEVLRFLAERSRIGWLPAEEELSRLEEQLSPAAHQTLLEIRRQISEDRENQQKKLASLEPLLKGGDPNRGHELFLERLACSACHRIGKTGGLAGPDLSKIGAIRSGRDILESILFPSSTIAQGYDAYAVKLRDGTEMSGVWFRQTDGSGVLRMASGLETPLQPEQIEKMERLKVSLMPEGLTAGLKEPEISDLLAYLQSLK